VTLRTRGRGWQWLAWLGAACVCVAAYVLAVRLFGSGHAAAWYAPEQMRFFLPFAVVFGFVAYETRWDGIRRESRRKKEEVSRTDEGVKVKIGGEGSCSASTDVKAEQDENNHCPSPPILSTSANLAWERAKEMPHQFIPDPKKDADYLKLVHQAADEGCVPALEKLGEYAHRRGAIVETYFWLSLAEKRGLRTARQKLLDLRKEWMLQECPSEYENVYEQFPEARGSVARALLRMACGFDVPLARQRLRDLAASGQSDAGFLLGLDVPEKP